MVDDLTSLSGLGRSLVHAVIDGVRRNKLAASLALLTLIVSATFAVNSQFDERSRYRELILPDIQKAEARFFDLMSAAEQAPTEEWRLYYFVNAHRRAKNVLNVAKAHWPSTSPARKAHSELIRYYDLVDEELAIIRTEMTINESLDYVAEWKRQNAELQQIRKRWMSWWEE